MMIMNVIVIDDGAYDGVFRLFWLTVLPAIKAMKCSHFIGMWMTFLLWITEDWSLALDYKSLSIMIWKYCVRFWYTVLAKFEIIEGMTSNF